MEMLDKELRNHSPVPILTIEFIFFAFELNTPQMETRMCGALKNNELEA